MWVPPEETDPVVYHAPTRRSVALFGAVNLRRGQMQALFSEPFNGETFVVFLATLLRRRARDKKLLLISDNASYHKSAAVRQFLADHQPVLELLYLPPYSPDLNPIERVWKLIRRLCTHNQYFPELEMLRNAEKVLSIGEEFIQRAPSQWSISLPVWPEALNQTPG